MAEGSEAVAKVT